MTGRDRPAGRRPAWPGWRVLLLVVVLLGGAAPAARAQTPAATEARLREQQQQLDRIRREREQLQRRMRELQGSVRDLSAEVRNLDRQAETTARLVASLDAQLVSLTQEVTATTFELQQAEAELGRKRSTLSRRVRDIYKRGPAHRIQALLSATSFADLLARYKYLHTLALRDRALVRRVEQLRDHTAEQRALLVRLQAEMETNRAEKAEEERRLRILEQERQRTLTSTRRSAQQTESRLTRLARDEARLRNVIATLEAARRRAESRANASAPSRSTIRTSDLGALDWPVEGELLYRFGRVVNPNNTTVRWNGIGIAAASGQPVKAIADGEVVMVDQLGTYGLTVIVQHGGGDYSVYGSLANAGVKVGAAIRKGQTVGTVGRTDPELPAHLHFEIRRDRGTAVDPLEWLKGNRQ